MSTRGPDAADRTSEGATGLAPAALLGGVLTAFGAFAVLIALTAGIARGAHYRTVLSGGTWDHLSASGGLIVAAVLFVAWLYGGYITGRLAGRAVWAQPTERPR